MKQIRLGRTDENVSVISLGTWSFGGANSSGNASVGWADQETADSQDSLLSCWKNGINHWDTADVYGDGRSEKVIGSMWNTVPRNDIFLATKVGWDMGNKNHWYNIDAMRTNMERSLINLKTDCVDLLYLHHCNFGKNDEYFDGALAEVRKFQEEGKTKFLGLSDWDLNKIMKYIKKADPDVVQPYRNVWDDRYVVSGLQQFIEENDLGVCFFSPLMHGLLSGKYHSPTTFKPGDFRKNIDAFKDQKIIDQIKTNANLLTDRFNNHPHPVMHGVVDTLLSDSENSCVLLGQRNFSQVDVATTLGIYINENDVNWIKQLYDH